MESENVSANNEMEFDASIDDEVKEVLGDDIGLHALDESTANTSSNSSKKRSRVQTSKCWQYFTKLDKSEDGKERAACDRCKKIYLVGGKGYGTTNLNKHIQACPLRDNFDVGQMLIDEDGRIRSKKINQNVFREKQAIAVIRHNYPFAMAEHEGHNDVYLYLNQDVKLISRNTLKADVLKVYKREKARLKEVLARHSGRICLTSDLWQSCTSEGYLCLTAHFVDDSWKLNSKVLSFYHMPPPHSGIELAQKIMFFLKEWGIEHKIFSITLDNASANDNMQDRLINAFRLHNGLLCDGDFFHIRYCAHILNLIVQDGLKVASGVLHKIRESVKYVLGSESRILKFEECAKAAKLEVSIGLRLDMPVRWNSTYLMLESAIRYRAAFSHLQVFDSQYKYRLSDEEWTRCEKICEFLEPFNDMTNLFSGINYPTSNLYFMNVWCIQSLLLENKMSGDPLLRVMAERMLEKFEKYWDEYSPVLAFGVVFDPRLKCDILQFCFDKINPVTTMGKIYRIKSKLKMLFEEYQKKASQKTTTTLLSPPSSSIESSSGSRAIGKGKDLLDEFDLFVSQSIDRNGKSELELYLEEPRLDRKLHANLNVLEHWRKEKNRYPVLSLMVRDILSIPITTVASKSSFSVGGRILNKYRSSLLPENFEALLCTRNWLYGFKSTDENEEQILKRLEFPICSFKPNAGSNQVVDVEEE